MIQAYWRKVALLLLMLALFAAPAGAEMPKAADTAATAPHDNNGKKWRIAYCETDPYSNYSGTLYGILIGLEKLGWIQSIEKMPYTPGQDDTKLMWKWLSANPISSYIEFVPDAHYSLIDGPEVEVNLLNRLKDKKDIDLVIAMGTASGKKLAIDQHKVPIMVFSSSNAVQSGIIKSETDSGMDNVWAHMDSNRYKRQVQVFHDIFAFKKLGMVFENSENGRIYAAIDDVKSVGQERKFETIEAYVDEPKNDADKTRYFNEVMAANRKLAAQVDAVYLTAGKWEVDKLPQLLAPFYEKGIPVFSQIGGAEVQYGALLSLYRANFNGIGRFGAENIVRLFGTTPLRKLPQVYGDTPSIVLNLEVADLIKYKIPFDILLVADKIYTKIEGKGGLQ
jgi:ABC-type uncharacterized transport system substrate-binding protein